MTAARPASDSDRPRPTLAKVEAITFDGDGTLWDFQSVMERALAVTLQRLREIVSNEAAKRLTVQTMVQIRDSVADELGEAAVSHEEIRYAAFLRTLEHVGTPSLAVAGRLYQLYMDARSSGITPYPDVPAALEALKGRYRLGMVSNGNTYPEWSGLPPDTFDFAVFAHECGFAKPDRRIFKLALAKCNCRSEEVLHVGDSLQHDVLGANGCGLRSAWLNRHRLRNETSIEPDIEVLDLHELVATLRP